MAPFFIDSFKQALHNILKLEQGKSNNLHNIVYNRLCVFLIKPMNLQQEIRQIAESAKQAFNISMQLSAQTKQQVLLNLADLLEVNRTNLKEINQKDIKNAQEKKLAEPLIDRLILKDSTIDTMIDGVKQIANMPDIIGQMDNFSVQNNGLKIGKMRVPIGVIAIIYESRPNVTIDAAALCFKSGNVAILRGGSEAFYSNHYLLELIHQSLAQLHLPKSLVQMIPTTDRQAISHMIAMNDCIDLLIPRGGQSLIARLMQDSKVPMIKHLDGICHVYIDEFADALKAINIAFNAKCSRYSACNTMETLLIHQTQFKAVLPKLATIYQTHQVELRVDELVFDFFKKQNIAYPNLKLAILDDWKTEYLAPVLAIKSVNHLDEAISHINTYSSKHTDSIVTENYSHSMKFLQYVDSASVMVNASTRFADGYEYGLGAEIGISNDKLHARGPVGLEGLTSQKYIVFGDGQVR